VPCAITQCAIRTCRCHQTVIERRTDGRTDGRATVASLSSASPCDRPSVRPCVTDYAAADRSTPCKGNVRSLEIDDRPRRDATYDVDDVLFRLL